MSLWCSTPSAVEALPCGSRSTTRTRQLCIASAAARLTALVVLPTPPFWFAIVITRHRGGRGHSFSPRFPCTRNAAAAAWAIGWLVSRETSADLSASLTNFDSPWAGSRCDVSFTGSGTGSGTGPGPSDGLDAPGDGHPRPDGSSDGAARSGQPNPSVVVKDRPLSRPCAPPRRRPPRREPDRGCGRLPATARTTVV